MRSILLRSLATLALACTLAVPAPVAPAAAAPPRVGAVLSADAADSDRHGLDTVEALLEDLSFRNLELHDREALLARPAPSRAGSGTIVFSVGDGASLVVPAPVTVKAAGTSTASPPNDLAGYLRLLDRIRPGGVVSGMFHDWRTPSVYRAMAGRHNGYDIAYPAGTPIAAGWAGQVVAVSNWYGAEHGITVASPDGFRVTYGHLSPSTRVGAWVNPGDIVGRVVRDHVDVKMRGADGAFIDFGRGVSAAALHSGNRAALASRGGVVLTLRVRGTAAPGIRTLPPLAGPAWTRNAGAVRAAIGYLRVRHQEAMLLSASTSPQSVALATVHRQIDDARGRLLVNAVPEEVLLAAFVRTPAFAHPQFSCGENAVGDALVEVVTPARPAVDARAAAREALPALQALLAALNAQAPPERRH